MDENNEVFCDKCNLKYVVADQKFAPCQKAEILALGGIGKIVNLGSNISVMWLIDPFVNALEIGEVINFTAYYFMCPQQ